MGILPTSPFTRAYRYPFPILIALAGIIIGGLLDVACPQRAEGAESPISISVDRQVGFAPLNIRIRLLITPHPDNRFGCIVVDGPLKYSSSCFPHNGESLSERINYINRLPEGVYVISGEVRRAGGKVYSSSVVEVTVQ